MNRKGLIIIVTPTLLLIFVFFWLDMFQQNKVVSDRQIHVTKQENGLKSILAWTTRHEKILPGENKVLKCSSGEPQCIWTNDR